MVKRAEVKQVLAHNWFHIALMLYTAVMVIVTDFLTYSCSFVAEISDLNFTAIHSALKTDSIHRINHFQCAPLTPIP